MLQSNAQSTLLRTPDRLTDPGSSRADPYKWTAVGLILLFMVTLPALLALIVLTQPTPPPPPWSSEAVSLGVMPYEISHGQSVYRSACVVCHGPEGEGVPRLGKPLRNSG
ncbi:MAG: hypothetical protein KDK91_02065, partial [Gammaproteobacteria bacterium]|nr:hypothetical protein [Gammaproteobacteria bacterium]